MTDFSFKSHMIFFRLSYCDSLIDICTCQCQMIELCFFCFVLIICLLSNNITNVDLIEILCEYSD